MAGFTNRGKKRLIDMVFRAQSTPTNLYLALVTATTAPNADTNVLSDLEEIASGNGYSAGGISLSRNTTDFPNLSEDDTNNWATIDIKALTLTPSGGPVPASGGAARYAVLLDDNGTPANRDVLAYFDLGGSKSVGDGQPLYLGSVTPFRLKLAFVTGDTFFTNRGLARLLKIFFQAQSIPTNFYLALFTSGTTPTDNINTVSDLTQIATGNGYSSGGVALARGNTAFNAINENDTSDLAAVTIADTTITASGGSIPASGGGAKYAGITDDNGTVASREVLAVMTLSTSSEYTVSDTFAFTFTGCKLELRES